MHMNFVGRSIGLSRAIYRATLPMAASRARARARATLRYTDVCIPRVRMMVDVRATQLRAPFGIHARPRRYTWMRKDTRIASPMFRSTFVAREKNRETDIRFTPIYSNVSYVSVRQFRRATPNLLKEKFSLPVTCQLVN